ncbi:L-aspartate oxidase (plasmid) [Rhizobium grahamii]|uniref:L-aspartate oxidase n=1 Tax=Rhizobium grahamii TaxID=1120045 RepID=A0A5Q0CDN5_9HYPH|nr:MULTISPECIES: L-aspartate oxidase [Rhizobium]QFY63473.1 L-aspartate oxidase [Rhizobium grahamii]QRM51763.1 L-aspartate oxidase [Rhizobium sp. BG6]
MSDILEAFRDHVVIVGGGLAGMMTALQLAPQPVLIVSRGKLAGGSSSVLAQGGIAAALADDDSPSLHLQDTLRAGDGLCDEAVARSILADAGQAVAALERAGVSFDRDADGRFAFGLEAAHQRRRIIHARGDGTGAAITQAMAVTVSTRSSISLLEGCEATAVLTSDGAVSGLQILGPAGAAVIPTSRIVLATGGVGGLYEATTNPLASIGQAIAMAARAGAVLADLEFVQFHPTALACSRRPMPLVSEAVRGEGAILINDLGDRFMVGVDGEELAPRDVVSRAIAEQFAQGRRVFLDARSALGIGFAARFPTIHRLCHEAGIDPARAPIPVRPAAHYHMGGVATDICGRSSVKGLWVVGEAAATGLHGANRLASNSLLEAAVMGLRAADDISGTRPRHVSPGDFMTGACAADAGAVRAIVSRQLGVIRERCGLQSAIASLLPLARSAGASRDPALTALLIAVSALLREESRGAHARSDFPEKREKAERSFLTLEEGLARADTLVDNFARSA